MKRILISIFVLVVLSSCVAREQFVKKQVYTCTTNPQVNLKINDDLKFIKKFGENKSVSAPDASHSAITETFLFAKSDASDVIDRALIIFSNKIFREDIYHVMKCSWADGENIFFNEYTKFLDMRSCRIVGVAGPGLFKYLGVDLDDFDVDRIEGGYYFELREIIVSGKMIRYDVVYLQKVNSSLLSSYISDGLSVDALSPEQRKDYDQFLKNSSEAFEKI